MSEIEKQFRIHGLVQGIGFRPFVAEQADIYGVGGYVKNAGGEVFLLARGTSEAVDSFVHRLLQLDGSDPALPGAHVTSVEEVAVEDGERKSASDDAPQLRTSEDGERKSASDDASQLRTSEAEEDTDAAPSQTAETPVSRTAPGARFMIIESTDSEDDLRLLPPDIATCRRCERELFDRMNRRYRHPFISCTSCGPRFTIMESVPYDREHTTMKDFRLCGDCRTEYTRPKDPRRHAQTICCKSCGPVVKGISFLHMEETASIEHGKAASEVAIQEAAAVLKKGGIVAIKNVGGYHFAHLASDAVAARRLREAKAREEKPFAVMFYDIEQVEQAAEVGMEEEALLTSPARPIVLLRAKSNSLIAPEVCGDSSRIGAMLPADPIQILLIKETGPLVMTSGNLCGEPILTEDEDVIALAKLGICDYVLYHDRPILQGLDDSICQVVKTDAASRVQVLRRARGYVPQPVFMGRKLAADTFAAGGDLKAVFALGRKDAAFLSGHFGDLMDVRAEEKRRAGIEHLQKLLDIHPQDLVCDRHPKYVSVQLLKAAEPVTVQHHHAHILSVMAEHGLDDAVLGVAFDGTGYGDDATIWGGEFLQCQGNTFIRAGHLKAVPLAGGDAAAKDAYAAAEGFLFAAQEAGYLRGAEHPFTGMVVLPGTDVEEQARQQSLRRAALLRETGTVPSSSMGRLFDAAAVILGFGEANHFEGQLACRLQYAAERCAERVAGHGTEAAERYPERTAEQVTETTTLPFPIIKEPTREGGNIYIADSPRLIAELVRARNSAIANAPEDELPGEMDRLAYAFHAAVACMTDKMCGIIAGGGQMSVALSGGTFANSLLLQLLLPKLATQELPVYMNEKVPCTDGGIALGQLYAMTF